MKVMHCGSRLGFKVTLKLKNHCYQASYLAILGQLTPAAPRRSEAENFWNGFPDILVKGFLRSWMVRHETAACELASGVLQMS